MGDKGTVDRAAVDDSVERARAHVEFRNASRALQSGCTPDPDREAAQARCNTVNHRKNVLGS
jgi:hypothetical protein